MRKESSQTALTLEARQSNLKIEIEARSRQIHRDAYQMSIGEMINLYRDGELDIHPEFQRVFRWKSYQKTKLIESIMLNIPIPSIFVSQDEEGVWDVIDGVQRLSTIFEFVGEFKDDEGNQTEPLKLEGTDYLPHFEGMTWRTFTKQQQIDFKRSRIDVIIVKKESDPTTKYELFQRLNTGGTQLTGQEVRNCLMIMTSRTFYNQIKKLSEDYSFCEIVPITEQKESEQYRMELILRILIPFMSTEQDLVEYTDLSELLDKETVKLAQNGIEIEEFSEKFISVIQKLDEVLGEDTFKRYDGDKYKGPFLVSSFQAIVLGGVKNFDYFMQLDNAILEQKIQNMYSQEAYDENTKAGARAIPRLIKLSEFGEKYFSKHE